MVDCPGSGGWIHTHVYLGSTKKTSVLLFKENQKRTSRWKGVNVTGPGGSQWGVAGGLEGHVIKIYCVYVGNIQRVIIRATLNIF